LHLRQELSCTDGTIGVSMATRHQDCAKNRPLELIGRPARAQSGKVITVRGFQRRAGMLCWLFV